MVKDAEQHALAEQALADFAAKEGIALDPAPGQAPTATAVKSMGPATEKE
jgi:hypothetical protein